MVVRVMSVALCGASVLAVTGTGPVVAHAARAARPSMADAPLLRAVRLPGSKASSSCPACSFNWAGYAQVATKHRTFTEVTDTFVVPTAVTGNASAEYAADWIGIGGWSDRTLVQAGIQTAVLTIHKQSVVTYEAWTEILPRRERPLPMTISAGDTVTITVQEMARNDWFLQITDGSQVAERTVRYKSRGLSAEAIHERPCLRSPCNDPTDLAQLAQTSNVTFGPGSLSETGPGLTPVTEPLLGPAGGATLHFIPMVADDGTTVIATPSAPDVANDFFTVADGDHTPTAPSI